MMEICAGYIATRDDVTQLKYNVVWRSFYFNSWHIPEILLNLMLLWSRTVTPPVHVEKLAGYSDTLLARYTAVPSVVPNDA